ncbi:HNH endonuclease [Kitasatospora sp. NPDC087861]|uniref:HNH endonuclease n=1 Tax=Kitasatospora sp. NPDC087861 TaxID=3364070 RepID=UPI0037FAFEEE
MDLPPRADLGEWARLRACLVVTDRCWVFAGALSDDGYGRFHAPIAAALMGQSSPSVRPSRWMWHAHHGPIPSNAVIRHDCDRSWCVNPGCLQEGDRLDNLADAVSRDRLTHPGRVGKADRRGLYASAKAVRTAVLDALRQGTRAPDELEAVVAEAIAAGDPFAGHGTLFPAPPHQSVRHRQRKRGPDRPAPRWTADHPALF